MPALAHRKGPIPPLGLEPQPHDLSSRRAISYHLTMSSRRVLFGLFLVSAACAGTRTPTADGNAGIDSLNARLVSAYRALSQACTQRLHFNREERGRTSWRLYASPGGTNTPEQGGAQHGNPQPSDDIHPRCQYRLPVRLIDAGRDESLAATTEQRRTTSRCT